MALTWGTSWIISNKKAKKNVIPKNKNDKN